MKSLHFLSLSIASLIAVCEWPLNLAAQSADASKAGAANVSSTTPGSVSIFDAELNRLRTVTASEAEKIITDYWTPARRAAATPAYVKVSSKAADAPQPEDAAIGPSRKIKIRSCRNRAAHQLKP